MKDTFFTLLALAIPLIFLTGLVYMFGQGLYTVARDWQERRQMEQLRRETQSRRQKQAAEAAALSEQTDRERTD